jgi:hypothetical protein
MVDLKLIKLAEMLSGFDFINLKESKIYSHLIDTKL